MEISQLLQRRATGLPYVDFDIVHTGGGRQVAETVADCEGRGKEGNERETTGEPTERGVSIGRCKQPRSFVPMSVSLGPLLCASGEQKSDQDASLQRNLATQLPARSAATRPDWTCRNANRSDGSIRTCDRSNSNGSSGDEHTQSDTREERTTRATVRPPRVASDSSRAPTPPPPSSPRISLLTSG